MLLLITLAILWPNGSGGKELPLVYAQEQPGGTVPLLPPIMPDSTAATQEIRPQVNVSNFIDIAESIELRTFQFSDTAILDVIHGEALKWGNDAIVVTDESNQVIELPIFLIDEAELFAIRDPEIGVAYYVSNDELGHFEIDVGSMRVPGLHEITTGAITNSKTRFGAQANVLRSKLHWGPFAHDTGESGLIIRLIVDSQLVPKIIRIEMKELIGTKPRIYKNGQEASNPSVGFPLLLNMIGQSDHANVSISLTIRHPIDGVHPTTIAFADDPTGPYIGVDTVIERNIGHNSTTLRAELVGASTYLALFGPERIDVTTIDHPIGDNNFVEGTPVGSSASDTNNGGNDVGSGFFTKNRILFLTSIAIVLLAVALIGIIRKRTQNLTA